MKVQYKPNNDTVITHEAKDIPDLAAFLQNMDTLFRSETCKLCDSDSRKRLGYRVNAGNTYIELRCECGATLGISPRKQETGGGYYRRRRNQSTGEVIGKWGWDKYVPKEGAPRMDDPRDQSEDYDSTF